MQLQFLAPKNKKGGVVNSTVMGVGGLLIGVIIILVVISTLFSADLFADARVSKATINETKTLTATATTFGVYYNQDPVCTNVLVTNATGGEVVASSNYTVTATNCLIALVSASNKYNTTDLNISSTTTYDGISDTATRNLNKNFTVGIDNVSSKIPTILLIVAVVFLFGALVLLIKNARVMGIGEGSGSL